MSNCQKPPPRRPAKATWSFPNSYNRSFPGMKRISRNAYISKIASPVLEVPQEGSQDLDLLKLRPLCPKVPLLFL